MAQAAPDHGLTAAALGSSMRHAIISSIEAVVRCFLWLWMVYFVQRPQIACADYPFGPTEPFAPTIGFLGTVIVAAIVSGPIFAAVALLSRHAVPDRAARAFLAGSICEIGRFALDGIRFGAAYDSPCENPAWSLWGWAAPIALAGSAAFVAHWLIGRGLASATAERSPRGAGRERA